MTTFKTRERFREHGSAIPTQPRKAWWWPVVGTLAVLLLISGASWLDAVDSRYMQDKIDRHQAEMRNQWEQGRQAGHQEAAQLLVTDLRAAWQAGLDEGQERCAVRRTRGMP